MNGFSGKVEGAELERGYEERKGPKFIKRII